MVGSDKSMAAEGFSSSPLVLRPGVLMLVSCETAIDLSDVDGAQPVQYLDADQAWLVCAVTPTRLSAAAPIRNRPVPAEPLCRLLACADVALRGTSLQSQPAARPQNHAVARAQWSDLDTERGAHAWLLRCITSGTEGPLLAWLRTREAYGLVRHLFESVSHMNSVRESSESYGLSYSYYRKLGRAALGTSVKAQLKQWRVARSVLEIVTARDKGLATIAQDNGYASSSHISTEIKNTLGHPPRTFARARSVLRGNPDHT